MSKGTAPKKLAICCELVLADWTLVRDLTDLKWTAFNVSNFSLTELYIGSSDDVIEVL